MIQIIHQRKKCIGCYACVEVNRSRWRMSRKDGKSTLIDGIENQGIYMANVFDDEFETTSRAARNCPVKIIRLEK